MSITLIVKVLLAVSVPDLACTVKSQLSALNGVPEIAILPSLSVTHVKPEGSRPLMMFHVAAEYAAITAV